MSLRDINSRLRFVFVGPVERSQCKLRWIIMFAVLLVDVMGGDKGEILPGTCKLLEKSLHAKKFHILRLVEQLIVRACEELVFEGGLTNRCPPNRKVKP